MVAAVVSEAVERDIALIAARDPRLAGSALAATARALAVELDGANSATSKSMCARVLLDALERLAALAPAESAEDAVDDLAARRAVRQAGAAG